MNTRMNPAEAVKAGFRVYRNRGRLHQFNWLGQLMDNFSLNCLLLDPKSQ
jgi:hypothetical protein